MALQTIRVFTKRGISWFFPEPEKPEDGRDQWPSRAAFLLAAMGGCAGQGNLLRYPSVVYNNYGLQWFIPYLLAVFLIAIPALVLEIAIGQTYRGGSVIAFNNINRRLKGVGIGPVFVSFIVVQYFTVNLAWIMIYFRNSFTSPLPWENRIEDFYNNDVVANPAPIVGSLTNGGKDVASYTTYPAVGLIGETVGWSAFIWFLIWFSIFRGVGMTGRVVYFTMGLPIITTIVFVAVHSRWTMRVLESSFSGELGEEINWLLVPFGRLPNVLFENFAAFAIFGIIGFLRRWPSPDERLGAFVVGFLTLPEAVLQMPGANFWAVLLFLTLIVLGFSSAFVMLDVVATLLVDSGVKYSRPVIVTALTLFSFLMCLPYCTEFGYYLLDGVDRWINNIALIFVVFCEVVSATTVYRWKDVTGQVGLPAFIVYNLGYFGGLLIGISVAHGLESAGPGAGAGFGFFVICTVITGVIAKSTETHGTGMIAKARDQLDQLWYLAFYSGNQLRHDLNLSIASPGSKNWKIPFFLPILLRYVSGPVLAIILSFAFPEFHTLRYDPMMITGFILSLLGMLAVLLGFVMPRYYDAFIPIERRDEGTKETVLNQPMEEIDAISVVTSESDGGESGSARDKAHVTKTSTSQEVAEGKVK
ncbi:SNF-domain-containing protein, partial [Aureobasidium melanogenum]